jgi:hypothetical protein
MQLPEAGGPVPMQGEGRRRSRGTGRRHGQAGEITRPKLEVVHAEAQRLGSRMAAAQAGGRKVDEAPEGRQGLGRIRGLGARLAALSAATFPF